MLARYPGLNSTVHVSVIFNKNITFNEEKRPISAQLEAVYELCL